MHERATSSGGTPYPPGHAMWARDSPVDFPNSIFFQITCPAREKFIIYTLGCFDHRITSFPSVLVSCYFSDRFGALCRHKNQMGRAMFPTLQQIRESTMMSTPMGGRPMRRWKLTWRRWIPQTWKKKKPHYPNLEICKWNSRNRACRIQLNLPIPDLFLTVTWKRVLLRLLQQGCILGWMVH